MFWFNKKVIRHNLKRIQGKLHRTGCKISLPCFDDKRYMMTSIAWLFFIRTLKVNKIDKSFTRLIRAS